MIATPSIISANRVPDPQASGSLGLLPVIGAAGGYQLLTNDDISIGGGLIRGAAAGASIGSIFGTPGIAIGAGIGGIIGAGKGVFSRKSTKEIQAERRKKLIDNNVTGYRDFLLQSVGNDVKAKEAIRNQEADPALFVGFDPKTDVFVNEKFAKSRLESDLTPRDIWGSEGVYETFGNDWLGKYSEQNRFDISQALIDGGVIREKKGGVYITDLVKAKALADNVLSGDRAKGAEPMKYNFDTEKESRAEATNLAYNAIMSGKARLMEAANTAHSLARQFSGDS